MSINPEETERAHLEALLAAQGVRRIVVGHSKVTSTVLPRFGGRVLVADIGVPRGHTDPHAFLIIENGAPVTVHRRQHVPVEAATPEATCAYLARIAAIDGNAGPGGDAGASLRSGGVTRTAGGLAGMTVRATLRT